MGLMGLHDSYGFWHLYIYHSLLGLSQPFFVSIVSEGHFMLCYYDPADWLVRFAGTVQVFHEKVKQMFHIL